MRLIPTNHITAAVLAAALAMPVAAFAQTKTTTPTTPPAAAGTMQNEAAAPQSADAVRQRVEQHIADLYATLKITPAQEKQWNQFSQVMLENADQMYTLVSKDHSSMETASAVQTMENYAAVAKQHERNVDRLLPAFKTLYASLTPEQKKAADEAFRERAQEHEQMRQGSMQNEQKGMNGTQNSMQNEQKPMNGTQKQGG